MAQYTYSPGGKLLTATSATVNAAYTYDRAGERLRQSVNGSTIYTLRDPSGQTLSEYTNPCGVVTWSRDLIYGGGRLLGAVKSTAQTPIVSFSTSALAVGESSGTASVGVTLTTGGGPLTCAVTAAFHTTYGTATAGVDYTSQAGVVTFPAGSLNGAVQNVSIPILSDALDEDDETFQIDLSSVTGGRIGSTSRATVTITDDDPTPTLSINDVSVSEGQSGTTFAHFVVSLSAPSGRVVQVQYATANGTATAGADYGASSGTLTIPAGASSGFINVPVYGDLVPEPSETFVVNLSGPVNATLADTQGVGTILNDDTVLRRRWGDFHVPRDGRADPALFDPSSGMWTYRSSDTLGVQTAGPWGTAGDIPVPADYDGDGKTDCAVYRPSVATWYILPACGESGAPPSYSVQWGTTGDVVVPADYDGDGKADIAIFRPSNNTWYIRQSSNGVTLATQWGQTDSLPVPGDYDGDGKADLAYYTAAADNAWWIQKSTTGGLLRIEWGMPGTVIPTQSDYDGDGKTDVAFFYPSNQCWYIVPSSTGVGYTIAYGTAQMTPADYDGDGKADLAQYDPSTRTIYMLYSSSGSYTGIGMADVMPAGVVPVLKRPQ